MYIPEIMEHFLDSFPLVAMMYPPDTEGYLLHLRTDVFTLTHVSIDSSIIATTHWGEEKREWNGARRYVAKFARLGIDC